MPESASGGGVWPGGVWFRRRSDLGDVWPGVGVVVGGWGVGGAAPLLTESQTPVKTLTLATTSLRPVIMSNHIIKMLRFNWKKWLPLTFLKFGLVKFSYYVKCCRAPYKNILESIYSKHMLHFYHVKGVIKCPQMSPWSTDQCIGGSKRGGVPWRVPLLHQSCLRKIFSPTYWKPWICHWNVL